MSRYLFTYELDSHGFRISVGDRFETVRSLGEGIEREVIHTIFEEFRCKGVEYFTPRADGYSTLTVTHTLSTAQHIPRSRLRNLSVLGAITSLCLIHGMSPMPLDPVLLQFFVHDCDLASLHPAFIAEWHAEIKQTITAWLETGSLGDISQFQQHFATYHDMQVILACSGFLVQH